MIEPLRRGILSRPSAIADGTRSGAFANAAAVNSGARQAKSRGAGAKSAGASFAHAPGRSGAKDTITDRQRNGTAMVPPVKGKSCPAKNRRHHRSLATAPGNQSSGKRA